MTFVRNADGSLDPKGLNPFDYVKVKQGGVEIPMSRLYPTYNWISGNGYERFAAWVESAAKGAGE